MGAPGEDLRWVSGQPPAGGLLLWDGGCGFCSRSVALLQRIARSPVPVSPVQAHVDSLNAQAVRAAQDQVLWVDPAGAISAGVEAVSHALRAAGRPWLGAVLALPVVRTVAAAIYRLIARNRHRLGGSGGACQRPL